MPRTTADRAMTEIQIPITLPVGGGSDVLHSGVIAIDLTQLTALAQKAMTNSRRRATAGPVTITMPVRVSRNTPILAPDFPAAVVPATSGS